MSWNCPTCGVAVDEVPLCFGIDAPWRALVYFGWLCSPIPAYPSTSHLKLSVQSPAPGRTPLFTVEATEHPLAIDQCRGISIERWNDLAHRLLHE
jgi:endogenous inhibitor of DNA gyrase (YacG/DUF329 family)